MNPRSAEAISGSSDSAISLSSPGSISRQRRVSRPGTASHSSLGPPGMPYSGVLTGTGQEMSGWTAAQVRDRQAVQATAVPASTRSCTCACTACSSRNAACAWPAPIWARLSSAWPMRDSVTPAGRRPLDERIYSPVSRSPDGAAKTAASEAVPSNETRLPAPGRRVTPAAVWAAA